MKIMAMNTDKQGGIIDSDPVTLALERKKDKHYIDYIASKAL
jgi:hypothetical protein